jgi:hypothetical protein
MQQSIVVRLMGGFARLGESLFFSAKRKVTKRNSTRLSRPYGDRCDARKNRRAWNSLTQNSSLKTQNFLDQPLFNTKT